MSYLAHFSSPSVTTMPLSESTVSKLADALKPDIVQEIYDSEKYYDFMTELIGEALSKKLGNCDPDLFFDLGLCLMDRIEIR